MLMGGRNHWNPTFLLLQMTKYTLEAQGVPFVVRYDLCTVARTIFEDSPSARGHTASFAFFFFFVCLKIRAQFANVPV